MARKRRDDQEHLDPFAEICAELRKSHEECIYLWGDELLSTPKFRFNSGSNLLDMVLAGGVPSGRVIEVYGWPGTGKTTLCCGLGASAQAQGGFFFYGDSETAFDSDRAVRLGVSPERFLYSKILNLPDGFTIFHEFLRYLKGLPQRYIARAEELKGTERKDMLAYAEKIRNAPSIVALDSVAASDVDESIDANEPMADKARSIRKYVRKLLNPLAEVNATLVIVNHLIENIGSRYPNARPETSGGWAVKYWASARLELTKGGRWMIGDREVGLYTDVHVRKSKFSPSGYSVRCPLGFLDGFDRLYEAFDYLYASKCGVVTETGGWYHVNGFPSEGQNLSLRYSALRECCEANPKLVEFLLARMREVFYGL